MSQNQCSIAYSPSFGYDLAARRVNGSAGDFDLSAWRVAGIGGDMVRADVLERFAEAFAVAGFKREAFVASYGMAEATLAVTFAPLASSFSTDRVDSSQYKTSAPRRPGGWRGCREFRTDAPLRDVRQTAARSLCRSPRRWGPTAE